MSINQEHAKERLPQLPGLRQDLHLLAGEAQADGVPTWRIHDPVRNRFFDVGWIEFELLQRWQEGSSGANLIAEVCATTPLRPTYEELAMLVIFLEQHQLLAANTADRRDALKRRCSARKLPLWKQLLHHYLFFRIPLLRPDAWLDKNAIALSWIFGRRFIVATIVAGLTGLFLASRQSDALTSAFGYFFNAEGIVFYALATTLAKAIHEFGHALSAKRYGLRIPTVGVAFLVMMPVLYTDTSESWKLTRRSHRLAVVASGIGLELMLAAWTTLGWALVPDGAPRSALFLLATTTWVWTVAINASPFMRFDGYFLLSDFVQIPNLHERSFALARRMLRKVFFGFETPDPEPGMSHQARGAMIMFAIATSVYRLVLFLGIAVLVYTFFFKVLGIFLMAVEIGWFIALPIWNETKEILREKERWHLRALPWTYLIISLLVLGWLLPVGHEVSAPALARARLDSAVFPPTSAYVAEVKVAPGQEVRRGEPLVRLESPDLENRVVKARIRADGYAGEVTRTVAGNMQLERRLMLEEQLGEALADELGAQAEIAALTLSAPHSGHVVDIPSDLTAGRWVNVRHPLLRIVDGTTTDIEAYLSERQIGAIAIGQTVKFYPNEADSPVLQGTVVDIDTSTGHSIPHPLLASIHGGGIAATQVTRDSLIAHEAIFRVHIRANESESSLTHVTRGNVRIQVNWLSIGTAGLAHIASVLVRESGF